jgi:hypothetical protein
LFLLLKPQGRSLAGAMDIFVFIVETTRQEPCGSDGMSLAGAGEIFYNVL